MKIKKFNESIKDHLKGKPKEDVRKALDKIPDWKKYLYIQRYDMEDSFTDEELEKYESMSPSVYDIGRWFNVEMGGVSYNVLIQHDDISSIMVKDSDFNDIPYDQWDDFEEIMRDYIL